jgi:hypothetical protein
MQRLPLNLKIIVEILLDLVRQLLGSVLIRRRTLLTIDPRHLSSVLDPLMQYAELMSTSFQLQPPDGKPDRAGAFR